MSFRGANAVRTVGIPQSGKQTFLHQTEFTTGGLPRRVSLLAMTDRKLLVSQINDPLCLALESFKSLGCDERDLGTQTEDAL